MSRKKVLIGIDLGTTGVKAVALDPSSGIVFNSAYSSVFTTVTLDGGHEQQAEAWWDSVIEAVGQLMKSIESFEIAAVGLSGHMHSLLLVDDSDKPLSAAMTWADRRVTADTQRLSQIDEFRSIAGNSLVDAFTAPKLAWFARTRPQDFLRAKRLVLAKDYIGFRLTGVWCTDKTDAIGTLLYDIEKDEWSSKLFEATGAPPSLGLDVRLPSELRGTVTAEASLATGLPINASVATGAGDVPLAALGGGVFNDRTVGLNVGTAAQALLMTAEPEAGAGFLFGSANGRDFIRMSSVYSAGASVLWAENNILSNRPINDLANLSEPGSHGLTYLPFMFGSASPKKSDSVRAAFFGLTSIHEGPDLASSVLEGIAFACADAIEALNPRDQDFEKVHLVGGVSNSRWFQAALSSTIEAEFFHVKHGGSALGAAITAGLGVGIFSNEEEAASAMDISPLPRIESSKRNAFCEARARYQSWCERLID